MNKIPSHLAFRNMGDFPPPSGQQSTLSSRAEGLHLSEEGEGNHPEETATHVQPASKLSVVSHLHVDALVQAEPDEIQGLLHSVGGLLLVHVACHLSKKF